jgi:hypothetical protein
MAAEVWLPLKFQAQSRQCPRHTGPSKETLRITCGSKKGPSPRNTKRQPVVPHTRQASGPLFSHLLPPDCHLPSYLPHSDRASEWQDTAWSEGDWCPLTSLCLFQGTIVPPYRIRMDLGLLTPLRAPVEGKTRSHPGFQPERPDSSSRL